MKRLALLAALLLALLAGSALAQGEIRILSQSQENRFPKEIVFRLAVEGDNPIQRITLFYRIAGGQVTNYAYPTFTPSRSVEAEYSLQTRGGQSIIPGSELEYYYEIEDNAGHKLKTKPITFTYEDTRFQWRVIKGDRLSVYWYGGGKGPAEKVYQAALRTMELMQRQAGASPTGPVKIYVYNSKQEMDVALPFRSKTTTQELVTQGEAFPQANLVMILGSDQEVEATTAHELTHLITHQLTDNPFASIPAWLNEGLSMYAEGELRPSNQLALEAAISSNTLLSLRTASSLPGRPEQVNLFYGEAYSVVKYLIDTYGPEKMAQLLAVFKQGSSADAALKQVYGFDTEGLENAWRAAVGAPPRPVAGAREEPTLPQTVPTLVPFGSKPIAPVATPAPPATPSVEAGPWLSPYIIAALIVVAASVLFLAVALVRSRG
jgi:acyl-CoA-binding protein